MHQCSYEKDVRWIFTDCVTWTVHLTDTGSVWISSHVSALWCVGTKGFHAALMWDSVCAAQMFDSASESFYHHYYYWHHFITSITSYTEGSLSKRERGTDLTYEMRHTWENFQSSSAGETLDVPPAPHRTAPHRTVTSEYTLCGFSGVFTKWCAVLSSPQRTLCSELLSDQMGETCAE